MGDIQNAALIKERILSVIHAKGPSLPIHIARAVTLQPLFASAFLSELYNEGKIKLSHMRVGSSPLYYIEGQQNMLENSIEHLNHKEKEAFFLLKKEQLLEDDSQEPAIRVALRSIRDFAVPLKLQKDQQEKIFWKYFLLPDSEIHSILNKFSPPQAVTPTPKVAPESQPKVSQEVKIQESPKPAIQQSPAAPIAKAQEEKPRVRKKKTKEEDLKFCTSLKEYLKSKDIELIQMLIESKKEAAAKVRLDTPLGKQEFYLIAKDKKKITEEELTVALHRAQVEKMPALLLAPAEPDKKAQEYLKTWRNLIKFEKVKL